MVPDAARHADNFGTILVGILWSRQRRTTLNPSYSVCFRRTCALLRSRRARFWTQSESKNTRKIGRRSTYRGRRSENEKYTRGKYTCCGRKYAICHKVIRKDILTNW